MEKSFIGNRSIETDKILRGALLKDLYRTLNDLKKNSEKLIRFLYKALDHYYEQGMNDSMDHRNRILDFLIYFEQMVPETDLIIDNLITNFDELEFLEDDINE